MKIVKQIVKYIPVILLATFGILAHYIGYTVPMKIAIIISMVLAVVNIVLILKGAYRGGKEETGASSVVNE